MKKILIVCAALLPAMLLEAATSLSAAPSVGAVGQPEQKTLLGDPVKQGVYATPVLKFGAFGPRSEGSLIVGAQGGWILDHRYVLGLGVYGLSTPIKAAERWEIEGLVTIFNYGGLMLSYIHHSNRLVHAEATMLIGVGEVNYRDEAYWAKYPKGDNYIVIEPGINLILNLTRTLRAGMGLGYRHVGRMNIIGMNRSDVSGVNFNLLLQVGYF